MTQTTLMTITKDPFARWKKINELAKARGDMPWVVWLDRGTKDEVHRLQRLGAEVHRFDGKGYCESAVARALDSIRTDWVLWVSDDELPGKALWRFAQNPPARRAFRVRLISLLADGTNYGIDQFQARLFPSKGSYIPADEFECGLQFDFAEYDALSLVLWHYCNLASRQEREAKVARYIELEKSRGWPGYADVTRQLYLYENYPVLHRPLAPEYARQLP